MKFTTIQKKWICLFLIAIMILSGMCFQNKKAHSSFECNKQQSHTSVFTSISSYTLTNRDMCTEEFIGNHSTNQISQNGQRTEKKETFLTAMTVTFLTVLLDLSQNIFNLFDGYSESTTSSHITLICYIHHQDTTG